jgi:hypothetical protein
VISNIEYKNLKDFLVKSNSGRLKEEDAEEIVQEMLYSMFKYKSNIPVDDLDYRKTYLISVVKSHSARFHRVKNNKTRLFKTYLGKENLEEVNDLSTPATQQDEVELKEGLALLPKYIEKYVTGKTEKLVISSVMNGEGIAYKGSNYRAAYATFNNVVNKFITTPIIYKKSLVPIEKKKRKGLKSILCLTTGEVFDSLRHVCKTHPVSINYLNTELRLNNYFKSKTGMEFKYL